MANTLFDQLKKTGLVNKNKANKIKHDQYKDKKNASKKALAKQREEVDKLAQQSLAEKTERDRQMNQKIQDDAKQKAIAAQIKQLIETNTINDFEGEIIYNFTDAGLVKRIHVSEQVYQLLMSGRVAVAKLADSYKLVPKLVADKIKQRDDESIITTSHDIDNADVGDDPYADYKIPDDLMW